MQKILILMVFLASLLPLRLYAEDEGCKAVKEFLQDKYHVKFTSNNSVALLTSGQEKFDDLIKAVSQARKSIHLEYFNFRNDSISEELFTVLAQKAAEGVEVRALFDGFGNSSNNRPLRKRHLQQLREHGVEIYEFDPLRFPWINHAVHRDHRKIVVIDGMIAYTGGMNVADYYIHGRPEFGEWRDMHLRVEGDAVGGLQGIFLDFWNKVTGQNIHGEQYYPGLKRASDYFSGLKPDTTLSAGKKVIGIVNRDPYSSAQIINETFIECIDNAQQQIQIVNPYFTLLPKIKRALKRAIKRGVDVQIMVSANCDISLTPRIVEYRVYELMKAGASIFIYEGGFHHSKVMTVDSTYSFLGSANLNSRSIIFDYECNLLIDDPHTTRELQRIFERDKQTRCYRLTPEIRKQMPWFKRAKGHIFRILTPFVSNPPEQVPPHPAGEGNTAPHPYRA